MFMRLSWLCAVLVGGAALLSLSACSDSSDVGLGVGPPSDSLQGGQPLTLDVSPSLADTARDVPITGENARQPPNRDAWRFLAGTVNDPASGPGVIEAEGYVDFAGRNSLPSAIASADDADSLTAELRLPTVYLHGIADGEISVEVYDLTEEATMDSARADASFEADEMNPASVSTAQISPTDSLVTIELRQNWIRQNLTVLQDTSDDGLSFEDNFSGFKIVAPNSEAVVGFSSSDAALRLTHVSDTASADFPALKTFTHITERNAASAPTGYKLLQGGVGAGLTMEWDFDAPPLDTLRNAPLNRAEIFVPVDTSELNRRTGPDFSRPLPSGFRVVATRHPDPDTPSCSNIFGVLGLATGNRACTLPLVSSAAPAAALVSNDVARPIFAQSFRRVRETNGTSDPPLFTTFRVFAADRQSADSGSRATLQPGLPTTVPVLIPDQTAPEDPGPPRATLTVTPL